MTSSSTSWKHVWHMEADVGWIGNLPHLLSAAVAHNQTADFVSFGCWSQWTDVAYCDDHANKEHCKKRNYLKDEEVHQCQLLVFRFSTRLLSNLCSDFLASRRAFCEFPGPSFCTQTYWCQSGFLNDRYLDPEFAVWPKVSPENWSFAVSTWHKSQKPGQIFHGLKW